MAQQPDSADAPHFAAILQSIAVPLKNEIVGVRHARALSNEKRILVTSAEHGYNGYGLVELGREQSREGGKKLQQKYGERLAEALVISSPFLRPRETAQIMGEVNGLSWPHQIDPRLSERFFGAYDFAPVDVVAHIAAEDRKDPYNSEKGVESPVAVATRFASLLAELEQSHHNRLILLFSHMDTLRIIYRAMQSDRQVEHYGDMLNWPNADFKSLQLEAFRH